MEGKYVLISEEQLKKIFKNVKADKCKLYVEAFNKILPKYGMTSPQRIAAFLGQIAVESGELKYDKELPSKWNKKNPKDPKEPTGTLYEGRKTLGNVVAGDGPRYIGRGVLQLTGRANYAVMSKKIGVDILSNPELACSPEVSVQIACQFFADRGLLELSDKWNLDEVTRRVNGNAKLHLKERIEYSERALKVLTENHPMV